MAKIKSKKTFSYSGKVYDIEVENSHSYNIEGIAVHNSSAGSLISWALDITKIDPIKFGLYFERFLNPTRNSPPDIDVDVTSGTDHLIYDFLENKYGKDRVMPVGTFSTYNEKGCLKDVVRAYLGDKETGFDSDVFQVTKEMPDSFEKEGYTLSEWIENYPKLPDGNPLVKRWLIDPRNKTILEQTLALQSQIKGIGQHAAGVVITPRESWYDVPTAIIPRQSTVVTAFQEADKSGKDLSELGLLKLDILKLGTINIIVEAIDLIRENHGLDVSDVIFHIDEKLDDPNIYSELRLGMNHGIFQFESAGMNSLIRGISIESFDEMVAANALFRPGPMGIGAHYEYIQNKMDPKSIKYIHPVLEEVLGDTKGVLVFQEQLQLLANRIADMPLGEGDMLRRYMDKASKLIDKKSKEGSLTEEEENSKDYKEFMKFWNKLLEGAEKKGYDKAEVDAIKDYLIKYLGYSFNKCLSANNKVLTETRGEVGILDVEMGEKVLGYNPETDTNEFVPVKDRHVNGKKLVYVVTMTSGDKLECTMDHKLMTVHGMKSLESILDDDLQVFTLLDVNTPILDNIEQIEEIGEADTFDLEIDSKHHNFYANGICVSNSHSVSYAFVAAQTLWLKHYYPAEFYCALLNHPKKFAGADAKEKMHEWMETTIASALSKGVKVKTPSRKSDWKCKITNKGEITLGFSLINGFGEIAYQELMELLKQKGKRLDTISMTSFFELPFSKFNKSVFESALKAGVFDDWSASREYLLNLKTKKKKKVADVAQRFLFDIEEVEISSMDSSKFNPTSEEDKLNQFIEVCRFNMDHIQRVSKITAQINERASKKKLSLDPLTKFLEDGLYYFFLNDIKRMTTKTGKLYLELAVGDGISKSKLRVFEPVANKILPELERGAVYIAEFMKKDKYVNLSRSAKFKKIVHSYSDELIP